MFGILVSFWDGPFSGINLLLVLGSVSFPNSQDLSEFLHEIRKIQSMLLVLQKSSLQLSLGQSLDIASTKIPGGFRG